MNQSCFHGGVVVERPNDPSSATRPTRACDCTRDAQAGLDAMKGLSERSQRGYTRGES